MQSKRNKPINFVSFSNDELNQCPKVSSDSLLRCLQCGKRHQFLTSNGDGPNIAYFYKCKGKLYLGAINQRLITDCLKHE